jgi:hypothetical protein
MRPAGAAKAFGKLLRRGLACRVESDGRVLFKITDYGREVADQAKEARPELHHLMKRQL